MPRGFAGGREKDRVAPGDCSLCVSGFRGSSHRPRRVHRGVRGFLRQRPNRLVPRTRSSGGFDRRHGRGELWIRDDLRAGGLRLPCAAGIFGSLPVRPGDGWPAGGQCSISTRSRPRPEPSQRGHGRGKPKAGSHFAGKRPPAGRIAIVMVTRARLSVRPEPLPAASGTAACRAGVPLQRRFVGYD